MSHALVPTKIEELWAYIAENPEAMLCAGGTDLLVKIRSRSVTPDLLGTSG